MLSHPVSECIVNSSWRGSAGAFNANVPPPAPPSTLTPYSKGCYGRFMKVRRLYATCLWSPPFVVDNCYINGYDII